MPPSDPFQELAFFPRRMQRLLEEGLLSVSGVRREPEAGEGAEPVLAEGSFGGFRRLISLPEEADPSSITARMKGGVLEIRAAKRKPRRLEISAFENWAPRRMVRTRGF